MVAERGLSGAHLRAAIRSLGVADGEDGGGIKLEVKAVETNLEAVQSLLAKVRWV